jgi:hypothetical protein
MGLPHKVLMAAFVSLIIFLVCVDFFHQMTGVSWNDTPSVMLYISWQGIKNLWFIYGI